MATDKNGLLWIGTTEGLNLFDGYKVSFLSQAQHRGLQSNNITSLFCDAHNRVWVGTVNGLSMIDSNRIIHPIIMQSVTNCYVHTILETADHTIAVMTNEGHFMLPATGDALQSRSWQAMDWFNQLTGHLEPNKVRDLARLADDTYFICKSDTLLVIDMARRQLVSNMVFRKLGSSCMLDREHLLVSLQPGNLYKVNLLTKSIEQEYHPQNVNKQSPPLTNITKIRVVSPGKIAVTTYFGGLCLLDPATDTYIQYLHNPLEQHSISENRTVDAVVGKEGTILITTFNSGLNIANVSHYLVTDIPAFADDKGHLFDGYINAIITDRERQVWMAAFDKIILWDRSNNFCSFMPYYLNINNLGNHPLEIKALCLDSNGRIWASIYEKGIALINKKDGFYKMVMNYDSSDNISALKSVYIHSLEADDKGKIWAAGGMGVFTIDTKTLAIDTLLHHPQLKELVGKRIFKIWFDHQQRIWFASQSYGVYCYDPVAHSMRNYNHQDGLPDGSCYSFAEDRQHTIYIGTSNGLCVLQGNRIKVYNESNGLKGNICTGLLSDDKGNIWIGCGHNNMARFSPYDSSFKYYSEESGFGVSGFRINAFYKAPDGEMFWGANNGACFFYPDKLNTSLSPLLLSEQKMMTGDSVIQFTGSATVKLSYRENNISFFFTAADLTGSKNILYEYKLENFDNDWLKGTDITQVKYNSLPPGKYIFKLRASRDGVAWTNSQNEILLIIHPPFWKTWWFRMLVILLIVAAITLYVRQRIQKVQNQERVKRKITELEIKALKAQMNPHFIFNAMNSIQEFTLTGDIDKANKYISRFSRLLRNVLHQSAQNSVLLSDEISTLQLYLEIESLRQGKDFSFSVVTDNGTEAQVIRIPSMLVQPFVENALHHGLANMEGQKNLQIKFSTPDDESLICEITDNGVGRKKAAELKSAIHPSLQHTPMGIQLVEDRLRLLSKPGEKQTSFTIEDIYTADGEPGGTKVTITIPQL